MIINDKSHFINERSHSVTYAYTGIMCCTQKNTDKGQALIIHNVKLYIKEAERQLNNTENDRPLPKDSTKINNDTVNKTIKRFRKEHFIKDKVAEG